MDIILQMSQVEMPDDLLEQVDAPNLLNNFRKTMGDLDNFGGIKKNHENRSFGKKLADIATFDSTLENAKMSAIETQAAFSKAIGGLMILNIAQAQRLQQQQGQLGQQQDDIMRQAQSIEEHTLNLQQQQNSLLEQNLELETLVKDFFELRGVTQEGAKRLITIASQVQERCDVLQHEAGEFATSVSAKHDAIIVQVAEGAQKIKHLEHKLDEMASQFSNYQNAVEVKLKKLAIALGLLSFGLLGLMSFMLVKF